MFCYMFIDILPNDRHFYVLAVTAFSVQYFADLLGQEMKPLQYLRYRILSVQRTITVRILREKTGNQILPALQGKNRDIQHAACDIQCLQIIVRMFSEIFKNRLSGRIYQLRITFFQCFPEIFPDLLL